MIEPRYRWRLPAPVPDPPSLSGFGPAVGTLLARRGLRTDAELERFLDAGTADLPSLADLTDATAALDRIEAAIDRREPIAIWGDYDADGMTAVAVWVLALRRLGVEPIRYIPSREAEGYGLSAAGLQVLAADGVRLVVTCDCGIGNAAEVDLAAGLGLDVVVTDHHVAPGELPRAAAVVDPRRSDGDYPDPDLTGAGLAFRLATALLDRRGLVAPDLAGLAAIGTIADMAPMTGETRAIVRLGLAELAVTERPGLRGLLARASETPSRPTDRDIGFGVVPRLNAAGRIGDARLALDLLVEDDPTAAERGVEELERLHVRRRALTVTAIAAARAQVVEVAGAGPVAVRDDTWLPGLLGLVAGRLADELARPVAAAAAVGPEIRGSVRAPADFHVTAALDACAEHLAKRGGHPAAGGFSLAPEAWASFARAFGALPRPFPDSNRGQAAAAGELVVDLVLPARLVGWGLLAELERLVPFGPGHVEPVLAVTGLRIGDGRRVGADGRHLSMRLKRGLETIDAIAFDLPADRPTPDPGAAVDVVAYLERRVVNDEPRIRLRVLDYADAAVSPLRDRMVPTSSPLAMAGAGAAGA